MLNVTEIGENSQHYKWDFSSEWVFRESCISAPYCKLHFLRVKEIPLLRNFLILEAIMPTIQGRFSSSNGSTFVCSFKIGGRDYSASGKFSETVPPFNTTSTITYCETSEITGTHLFHIVVGPKVFKLVQINGPIIDGVLTEPAASESDAIGNITWVVG